MQSLHGWTLEHAMPEACQCTSQRFFMFQNELPVYSMELPRCVSESRWIQWKCLFEQGSPKEGLHKWHFYMKNVECPPVQVCFKYHLQALNYNQIAKKSLSLGRKTDSQIIYIREFQSLIKNWSKLGQGFQDFALHLNVHSKSIHSKIVLHWEFTATRWLVRDDGFLKIPPILSSAK